MQIEWNSFQDQGIFLLKEEHCICGRLLALSWGNFFFPVSDIWLKAACMLSRFSHVQLSVTLCSVAHQAPLSMGFSRQKYWNGVVIPWQLEWVLIPSSSYGLPYPPPPKGSSQPRNWTLASFISCRWSPYILHLLTSSLTLAGELLGSPKASWDCF